MIDYRALATEMLNGAYAGLSDDDLLAALNAKQTADDPPLSWTATVVGIPLLTEPDLYFVRHGRPPDPEIAGDEGVQPFIIDGQVRS